MNEKQLLNQVKLNNNIEIIYKNLWSVNFDYLSNGWLEGITIDNLDAENYLTVVSFNRNSYTIIILNKGHKNYEKILSIFKFIMRLTIRDLQKKNTFYEWFRFNYNKYKKYSNIQINSLLEKHNLLKAKDFYDYSCLFEIQRRREEKIRKKKGR